MKRPLRTGDLVRMAWIVLAVVAYEIYAPTRGELLSQAVDRYLEGALR